jgi:rhamnulokinase
VFTEPGDMPSRIRAFCAGTGQPQPADPGAVARCILESLALKHAETIETLAAVSGIRPREIHVVGGGARNELLCRWTAEASGLPVLAGPEEATVLGNLLVQAISAGEISSLADGREVVRASVEPVVHEPVEAESWDEARSRFATLGRGRPLEVSA